MTYLKLAVQDTISIWWRNYVDIITYLKLARESTLSALHAFASSGQQFERIKAVISL